MMLHNCDDLPLFFVTYDSKPTYIWVLEIGKKVEDLSVKQLFSL